MLDRLPPEILLRICAHIDLAEALINLIGVSRHLRHFVFDFIHTGRLQLRNVSFG